MVQIVRKKKGRPSKADLARRLAGESPAKEPEVRRSHRRRNARFGVIDYDDFIDEEEEEEEEFEDDDEDEENLKRREKKLKLVVKLTRDESAARGCHAPPIDSEDDEDSDGERKRKKRRIDGIDDDDDDDVDDDGDGDENDGVCLEEDDDDEEESARKVDSKRLDSVLPGMTPDEARAAIPLPEKKILEMILDKLQKKDTYGVYAEPVDPEELPDYHDVIEHPMDFATVRKRLSDRFYSTLEQLESDVFLICSNAMQYNSSDTVYHKQARNIQELGRKKFEKLRIKFINSEREMKLAQKLKSNSAVNKFDSPEEEPKSAQKIKMCSSVKKNIRKPLYRTSQETVGSDFSSGATLATAGEILNSMNLTPEKPTNNDSNAEILNDFNLDKAEETYSAKGYQPKLGRKQANLEDNRRNTYNIPTQPVERPESVFTTFESEIKQLVAVGLHAEYAYARSLARFAATLGPIAWKAASQKIEQALPSGCKFGRGWVGEYEPLPTPVLQLETNKQKPPVETRKNERAFKAPVVPVKEKSDTGHFSDGRQSMFVPTRNPQSEAKQSGFGSDKARSEAKPSAFSSTGRKSGNNAVHQHQNAAQTRIFPKQEINSPERKKQPDPNSEKLLSRPFKLPHLDSNPGLPPNGKDTRSSADHRTISDPVQLMKSIAAEKVPNNTTAAAAAARAWMSIGAGSFKQPPESPESPYNHPAARASQPPQFQSQPQIARIRAEFPGQFHNPDPRNGFPVPAAFFPQNVHFQSRPVMFPQQVPADLSRFQMPAWQHGGLSPRNHPHQGRQRQENLPPDLNIGFQPPSSPVKQSSGGLMVESQHPDLALQL